MTPTPKSDKAWADDCTTAHMMGYADAEAAARAKVKRLEARVRELEAVAREAAKTRCVYDPSSCLTLGLDDPCYSCRARDALEGARDDAG
jgi:hypothetical protein